MQLGFDRQHFTLPRVGIFLDWIRAARRASDAVRQILGQRWVLIRIRGQRPCYRPIPFGADSGRHRHLGVAWSHPASRRPIPARAPV